MFMSDFFEKTKMYAEIRSSFDLEREQPSFLSIGEMEGDSYIPLYEHFPSSFGEPISYSLKLEGDRIIGFVEFENGVKIPVEGTIL